MPTVGSDVVVVGGGIIGATIAKNLTDNGIKTTLIDDGRSMGGTAASGGHLKPSWMGGMKKQDYEPAMELLDSVWGLKEEEFTVRPTNLKTTVWRVDTDVVLKYYKTIATVQKVFPGPRPTVVYAKPPATDLISIKPKLVIIAAGVWCKEFASQLDIKSKQGISFRMRGVLKAPFIKPWAPYKQVVAHQQGVQEIWVGDGTAILEHKWKESRNAECLERCKRALAVPSAPIRSITGLRPYCETHGKPCLFMPVGPNVYVATGAGKMGTIAAGWVAGEVFKLCN